MIGFKQSLEKKLESYRNAIKPPQEREASDFISEEKKTLEAKLIKTIDSLGDSIKVLVYFTKWYRQASQLSGEFKSFSS